MSSCGRSPSLVVALRASRVPPVVPPVVASLVLSLGASLAASPAGAAKAKNVDTRAPVIVHTTPECSVDAPCVIDATITDDSGVFEPTLLFRPANAATFERVAMQAVAGTPHLYRAPLPGSLLANGDVVYLLEAFDVQGNGPAHAGDEAAPLVLRRPTPTPTPTPAPSPSGPVSSPAGSATTAPPAVAEDNTGVVVGLSVGGAVVAVLAGVAIGVAVWALRPPAPDVVSLSVAAPVPAPVPASGATP
jgi:hypothetical protein